MYSYLYLYIDSMVEREKLMNIKICVTITWRITGVSYFSRDIKQCAKQCMPGILSLRLSPERLVTRLVIV